MVGCKGFHLPGFSSWLSDEGSMVCCLDFVPWFLGDGSWLPVLGPSCAGLGSMVAWKRFLVVSGEGS